MADYPDVYADGFSLTSSAFGLGITFTMTDPPLVESSGVVPVIPVVRVRLSRELAQQLVELLSRSLAKPAPQPTTESTTKH